MPALLRPRRGAVCDDALVAVFFVGGAFFAVAFFALVFFALFLAIFAT